MTCMICGGHVGYWCPNGCVNKEPYRFVDQTIGVLIRKLEHPDIQDILRETRGEPFSKILISTDIPELYDRLLYIAGSYGCDFAFWKKGVSFPRYNGIFWLSEENNDDWRFCLDGRDCFKTWLPIS